MDYSEKLKDPRWQKIRLKVLERDDFKCVFCGDDKSTLHVHHSVYFGNNPWDTPSECLDTLCKDCHEFIHINLSPVEKMFIENIRMNYDKSEFTFWKSRIRRVKETGVWYG